MLRFAAPVQGPRRLNADFGPVEPLTAAWFPPASQAETAHDEQDTFWDCRSGLAVDTTGLRGFILAQQQENAQLRSQLATLASELSSLRERIGRSSHSP